MATRFPKIMLPLFPLLMACTVPARRATVLSSAAVARGAQQLRVEEYELAQNQFRLALEYNRGNAQAWNGLGILAMKRGDYKRARALFRQALIIREGFVEAHGNLGALEIWYGNPKRAIVHLKRALLLHPGYFAARFNLGLAYLAVRKNRAARRIFALLYGSHPKNYRVGIYYAYTLSLTGSPLKALSVLRKRAGRRREWDPLVVTIEGVALLALQRYVEAKGRFLKALTIEPRFQEARFHLALYYIRRGSRAKGLLMLKRLLAERTPKNPMPGVVAVYGELRNGGQKRR